MTQMPSNYKAADQQLPLFQWLFECGALSLDEDGEPMYHNQFLGHPTGTSRFAELYAMNFCPSHALEAWEAYDPHDCECGRYVTLHEHVRHIDEVDPELEACLL